MFPRKNPLEGLDMICEREQPDYVPLVVENDEEGVCKFVDDAFDMILKDLHKQKPLVKNQIAEELKNVSYLQERKFIFNEQFLISNHMVKCYIKRKDMYEKDGKRYKYKVKLPLIEMRKLIPNSFISPWAFPSLLIFHEGNPCSANLSPTGVMNVTGGYNYEQLKDSIKFFCSLVIKALKKTTGKDMVLDDIHFKLRVASNKIGGKNFNLIALNDYCIKNNITASVYDPYGINRLKIKPLPLTFPSIGVNIFPSGGLVMYGFTCDTQAKYVIKSLECWLWLFITVDTDFIGWNRYLVQRSNAEKNRLKLSLKRKAKKIKDWEEKIKPKERRNIYVAWNKTADIPGARTFLRSVISKEENDITMLKKKYKKDPLKLAEKIKKIDSSLCDYLDILNNYLLSIDVRNLIEERGKNQNSSAQIDYNDHEKVSIDLSDEILEEKEKRSLRERLETSKR